VPISLKLPPKLLSDLDKAAYEEDSSRSATIVLALKDFVQQRQLQAEARRAERNQERERKKVHAKNKPRS
jgi:metal-responsive CopG/Arc/MetJ family transcriptional regulator